MDQRSSLQFGHKNATIRLNEHGDEEARALCHAQHESSEHAATFVVHLTRGCDSGFVCMLFHRRDAHVIELQQSVSMAHVPEEACQNLEMSSLPLLTLTAAALKPRKCPHPGRYTVRATSAEDCGQELVIGCRESDSMEFRSACASDNFSGHRHSTGARRSCFVYAEGERGLHFFSVPTDSCERGASGTWAFNITMDGPCEADASTESSASRPALLLPLLALLVLRAPAR
ncbi:hypothetical protein B566_EDAN004601 [Ephemera danica]|nr:hypothetical protein B566_EDAN004601 [Ephemera danica]